MVPYVVAGLPLELIDFNHHIPMRRIVMEVLFSVALYSLPGR